MTNPYLQKNPYGDSGGSDTSERGFVSSAKQLGAGVVEAVPVYGEKWAKDLGFPEPVGLTERTTRRAGRNLPYAALAATGVGAVPAALALGGSTVLGQAAEEFGVPKEYQPAFEIAGGGGVQMARDVAGRTLGYVQKPLQELASKAKSLGYEIGPSARAEQGMKYGAGATPDASIRNLNKFTEEATQRAGNKATKVDADWINKTQKQLGNEVNPLFQGKIFTSTPKYQQDIADIVNKAEGMFGEQGNIARTIIEKNIGGQRTGGSLLSPQFKAEDLRGAIQQVNAALSSAKGPQAKVLHDLKDSLEDLAQTNLPANLAKQYKEWRSKYNAFSTLRDAIQTEGREGITAAGQVNPKKLLDAITNRTGGDATRSPLFKDLGELGDILQAKVVQTPGALRAAISSVTESPLAKGLQTMLQPYTPGRMAGVAGTAQTLSPAMQYLPQQEKTQTPSKPQVSLPSQSIGLAAPNLSLLNMLAQAKRKRDIEREKNK